jgi:protein-tyrosine phosphatase
MSVNQILKEDENFGSMYLGPLEVAENEEILNNLKIKNILNVTDDIECFFPKSFTYKTIPIQDLFQVGITKYFDEAFQFIRDSLEKKENILVHCRVFQNIFNLFQAGQSRSASMVIMFLMKFKKMNLQDSFSFTQKCKPDIGPNLGFIKELMSLDENLFGKNSFNFMEYKLFWILRMDALGGFSKTQIMNAFEKAKGDYNVTIDNLFSE